MNAIPLSLLAAAALRLAAAERGYVDSTACRACHAAIFDSFSRTNMGRSFAPVSKRMDIPEPVDFTHAASGSRFTLRAGVLRHAQTGIQARVEWIVGSGAHSFTPVHVKPNGRLAELPLSWYSERGGYWAMSPGYDRPDHSGLRREISDGCLFCHNAYPSEANRGECPDLR